MTTATAGSQTLRATGFGTKTLSFENSPKAVEVRADQNLVRDDGFGSSDRIEGFNAYIGSVYSDYMYGHQGNETFGSNSKVSLGNDTYIGGGGYDVVLYAGPARDYVIDFDAKADKASVRSIKQGTTDTLEAISKIQFTDKTVELNVRGLGRDDFYGTDAGEKIDRRVVLPADRQYDWTHLYGGAGDDELLWRSGNILGGPGNDTITFLDQSTSAIAAYWDAPSAVYVNLKEGYALDGWGGRDRLINVSQASLSNFADTFVGSDGDDTVFDTWGGDTLTGGKGNDTLAFWAEGKGIYSLTFNPSNQSYLLRWGPSSSETITLFEFESLRINRADSSQNQVLSLSDASKASVPGAEYRFLTKPAANTTPTVSAGDGSDQIFMVAGQVLLAGAGHDLIRGVGYGEKSLSFAQATGPVIVRLDRSSAESDGFGYRDRLEGINVLIGGPYNDFFQGDASSQIFGSNTVLPLGNDTYIGGGGIDTVRYAEPMSAFEIIQQGNGHATIRYLKTGTIDKLEAIATIEFLDQSLRLSSPNRRHEEIWFGDGNDVIDQSLDVPADQYRQWFHVHGGAGDDLISWASGQILAGEGNDTIIFLERSTDARAAYWDDPNGVFIDLNKGFAIDGWGDRDTLVNVGAVSLSNFADTVIGSSGDDQFDDSWGGDSIDGGPGIDSLNFWTGGKGSYWVTYEPTLTNFTLHWSGTDGRGSFIDLKNVEYLVLNAPEGSVQKRLSDFIDWSTQAPAALIEGGAARWNRDQAMGSPVEVSFGFLQQMPAEGNGNGGSGFVALNSVQQDAIRQVFAVAAQQAGVRFKEAEAASAQIRIGVNQQTQTKGYSFSPDPSQAALAGDIWLDVETVANLKPGSEGFWVVLHELGHALGLRHPAVQGSSTSDQAVISADRNDMSFSVMSELLPLSGMYPQSFSLDDVLALQTLYGSPPSTLSNQVFKVGLRDDAGILTLVDSGGYDIIDASASSVGVTIYLDQGTLSSVGRNRDDFAAFENIAIAYGSIIEAVIGSPYDDLLTGTSRNDRFVPGEGNDRVNGEGGLDWVVFDQKRSDYDLAISPFSGRLLVTARDGQSGSDSLQGIERLEFSDSALAFDMNGSAGSIAKLIATVFGKASLDNSALIGRYLNLSDQGTGLAQLAEGMFQSQEFAKQWGPRSDESVARALVQHVFMRSASDTDLALLIPILKQYGQATIAVVGSELPILVNQVDLVGYAEFGLPYGP